MAHAPARNDDPLDPAVWKIAAVALFGGLLAQLDATIVNVSLSSLATELHASLATIQWVTSGYLLALALALPLNGWLVHRIGAKRLYLACFAAFTLASALCGLAWSAPSLIGFRLLQGLAGGLLAPMAQMMIARAAGPHLARVAGIMSVPVLFAPVLGPILAGFILQHASWRWLFLVNLPVGALAFALAILFLPGGQHRQPPRPLDWTGLLLLSPGLALFLYAIDRTAAWPGRILLAAAILMIALFIRRAWRNPATALIDLRLFRKPVFAAAAASQFLWNGIQFAGQILIPAFLIQATGRAPDQMGWLLAPQGLGMLLTYPFMGWLTGRFGLRRTAAGGALLALPATAVFIHAAGAGIPLLVAALFLRGVGLSTIGLPAMTAAYAAVPQQDTPMATTALNIAQRLGGPTLTTLCALCLSWRLGPHPTPHAISAAYAWAFLLLCGLHAANLLAALRLPPLPPARLPA